MREDFIFPPAAPENSPFRLHLAGSSYCDGNYLIARPRTESLWVLEYIECGTGTYEAEGIITHPSAGDLYFVHAGTDHRYYSDARNPWVKHWINFSGPLVAELEKLYRLREVMVVPGFSRPELFRELLHRLRQHPEQAHSRLGPEFLMAVVTTIVSDLAVAQAQPVVSETGNRLRSHLDRCVFGKAPSLDELAALAARSKVQTIRIFKRDFGETPAQYLIRRKIAAARELLRSSSGTIKEIAAALEFSDEYHFAALFKRKTGFSPGYYRRHE